MQDTLRQTRVMPVTIVTDLDGTLLDDNYDEAHAASVLGDLQREWPEIHAIALASSKTLAELRSLAAYCDFPVALIFENGGGWCDADGGTAPNVCETVVPYADIRRHIGALRERHGFNCTGFGDLQAAGVAAHTGLSEAAAERACQRAATEPLLWQDTPARLAQFRAELVPFGLRLVAGGRFLHVCSEFDKATAMAEWRQACAERQASYLITCGDAPNDEAMLSAADHAIVFPNRTQSALNITTTETTRVSRCGPEAWKAAMHAALGKL